MIYVFVKTPMHAWLQVPTESVVGAVGSLSKIGPTWSYLEKENDADMFIKAYQLTLDNLHYYIFDHELMFWNEDDFELFQQMHTTLNTKENIA
ncbi:hypothetical protein EVB94_202 [Rhizobium phage RHph_TM40]|nr:hypothetical protein EVB94_202 [Rhizobium phage RHph_TM40]QIG77789.1 hypothetical protein EVB64_202 [Rhizobium phage RHph_TM61]